MKNQSLALPQWRIFPTKQCASHSVNNRKHLTCWNGVKIHASLIPVISPITQYAPSNHCL